MICEFHREQIFFKIRYKEIDFTVLGIAKGYRNVTKTLRRPPILEARTTHCKINTFLHVPKTARLINDETALRTPINSP